ncbi:ribonuclease domain-containing protein [Limnohabitans sp.]|jgi:ribonuclease T1|uniref:ribonuclease domain-containing protein n=1 Tax=Limnohabitans sp. TaxID=1907725 RepID=UPI00311E66CA
MKAAKTGHLSRRGLLNVLGMVVLVCTITVQAKAPLPTQTLPVIALQALPKEGQETYRNIRKGGPFPYEKDGTVFGNRERILPRKDRGFYREYTVRTPGSRDRGARRIVCGGYELRDPQACYYTADHYTSFSVINDRTQP